MLDAFTSLQVGTDLGSGRSCRQLAIRQHACRQRDTNLLLLQGREERCAFRSSRDSCCPLRVGCDFFETRYVARKEISTAYRTEMVCAVQSPFDRSATACEEPLLTSCGRWSELRDLIAECRPL